MLDRLHSIAITNRHLCGGMEPMLVRAEAIAGAGVGAIMLREKDLTPRELFAVARSLAVICQKGGTMLIVNGSVEVALAAGVEGVQLGFDALPADAARRVAGGRLLIGVSAHSLVDVQQAHAGGADYATISPVFPPSSKAASGPAMGVERLHAIARESPLPLVALGGIEAANARACIEAGACGVAAIGAYWSAADPAAAARAMVEAVRRG
ncbi:MAG: thiamine phosphate synthase [Sumerlaeia bacterium]